MKKAIFLMPIVACSANAAVIYSNPFIVPGGAGEGANLALTDTVPDWRVYTGATGAIHAASSRVFITDRAFKNHPTGVYGVIAMDGTAGDAGNPKFTVTTGLNIDSTAENLSFNWLQGDANPTALLNFVVQVDGQWYSSAVDYTTPGQTIGEFASATSTTAVSQSLVFSSDAAGWNTITFDPGTELTLGGLATTDLSGPITGVGFFTPNSTAGTVRVADFNITAVPEPSTIVMGMAALLGFCVRRQR